MFSQLKSTDLRLLGLVFVGHLGISELDTLPMMQIGQTVSMSNLLSSCIDLCFQLLNRPFALDLSYSTPTE